MVDFGTWILLGNVDEVSPLFFPFIELGTIVDELKVGWIVVDDFSTSNCGSFALAKT